MIVLLRGRRVVVKADLPGERIGRLWIPDTAKSQPLSGEVVLKGDKCLGDFDIGDRVLFPSTAWSRFNAREYGFPFMLLKEQDLLCVMI